TSLLSKELDMLRKKNEDKEGMINDLKEKVSLLEAGKSAILELKAKLQNQALQYLKLRKSVVFSPKPAADEIRPSNKNQQVLTENRKIMLAGNQRGISRNIIKHDR